MPTVTTPPANGRSTSPALKDTLASFGEGVTEMRDDVSHLAEALGGEIQTRAKALAESARKTTYRAADAARANVQERPGLTLGLALGAGLILGLMMGGRR